jgi:hypothetical protein
MRMTGGTLLPLLQEALAQSGRFRWRLRGRSMEPTFPPDCEIEIVPLPPGGPALGDVLVFATGDTLIAHRLVRQSHGHWITHGDGRLGPDPPLRDDQVLGKVAAAYRAGRCIWPGPQEAALAAWWVTRHHMLRPVRAGWRAARRIRRPGP